MLQKIGAYNPKSDALTKFRRTQINKAWREYAPYIDNPRNPNFFIAAPTGSRQRRAEFLAQAQGLGMKTTPQGVFYAKGGHTKAQLRYDPTDEEFRIKLTGKVKRGDRKGKRYQDIIAVAPLDRINDERGRIRRMADEFMPLKKGEQVGFVLQENNREIGASRATFHSADALMRYIDANYHRDNKAAKLAFLRLISVRKTTLFQWTKDHPAPKRRRAGTPRRHKQDDAMYNVVIASSLRLVEGPMPREVAKRRATQLTKTTGIRHAAIRAE